MRFSLGSAASRRRDERSAADRRRSIANSAVSAVSAASVVITSSSCAGSAALERRMGRVAERLTAVEANGAMRCAPRELAVARSHLEFARLEETQGYPSRARQHLDVAEENIEAANVLSPPGRCAGAAAAPGAPAPTEPAR
jgi:OmpA-OmpF porin, OOP family